MYTTTTTTTTNSSRFDALPQPDNLYLATYLWIDSSGQCIRLKTRTLEVPEKQKQKQPHTRHHQDTDHVKGDEMEENDDDDEDYISLRDLPWWDSAECDTDRYLEPVRLFNDPFYPMTSHTTITTTNNNNTTTNRTGETEDRSRSSRSRNRSRQRSKNKLVLCETYNFDKSIPGIC